MKENEELVMLRISVARLAQAMGVDNSLQVANASYEQLRTIAKTQPREWSDLVGRMVEKVYLTHGGETVAHVDLRHRITKLEFQSSDRHERLRTLEGALTQRVAILEEHLARCLDRIAALEEQAIVVSNAVDERLCVLDEALTERIAALETKTSEAIGEIDSIKQCGQLLENLDNQEWFWAKIRAFTDSSIDLMVLQNYKDVAKKDVRDILRDVIKTAHVDLKLPQD